MKVLKILKKTILDFYIPLKCILTRNVTQEEFEYWQYPEIMEKIKEEPDNIKHYGARLSRRYITGSRLSVIEDETQIIRIVQNNPEKYKGYIYLYGHYFSIAQNAFWHAVCLENLEEKLYYYQLSQEYYHKSLEDPKLHYIIEMDTQRKLQEIERNLLLLNVEKN